MYSSTWGQVVQKPTSSPQRSQPTWSRVAGGEEEIKQPLLCFSCSYFLYLVFLALKKMQIFKELSSGDIIMHTLYQDQLTSYPFKYSPEKCLKSETSLVHILPLNLGCSHPQSKMHLNSTKDLPSQIWKKNRGRREREKLAAMLFTAGSTLFLPFKSGAKVGPISRRLPLVSASFPLFLLAAGEIQHAT